MRAEGNFVDAARGAGFTRPILSFADDADRADAILRERSAQLAQVASTCGLPVTMARERHEPEPGHVYLAAAGHHLTFNNGRLRLVADSGTRGHVPSGDALFRSLALNPGPRALGVLLTGMGEDGAHGLLEMRKAGAHTITQDRATCAVYGMPAVAASIGAACDELPIEAIAPRIAEVARGHGVMQHS